MPGLGDILGGLLGEGSVARQFFVWGVLYGIVSTATGPFQQELTNKVNSENPVVPLSPAELADMVVKQIIDGADAVHEAAKSGVNRDDFNLMITNAESTLAPGDVIRLFRRGTITPEQLPEMLRKTGIGGQWLQYVAELSIIEPTPVDILNALLEGQLSEETAKELYVKLGGDLDYFDILFNTQGTAPTPIEAADLANRGIIPWEGTGPESVSYEQAFLEGPWRNKWFAPMRKGAEYLPPPRTVTAMYNEGSITRDRAIELLQKQGLTADLAAAYVSSGSNQKTAKQRDLAVSTILALFRDKAISEDDTKSMLTDLGYDPDEAQFLITVSELERVQRYLNTAVNTVHTQYVNHRISKSLAGQTLDKLGVASGERDSLISLWDIELGAKIAHLTPAQIKAAFKKDIITADDAKQRLSQQGYTVADADIYLQL